MAIILAITTVFTATLKNYVFMWFWQAIFSDFCATRLLEQRNYEVPSEFLREVRIQIWIEIFRFIFLRVFFLVMMTHSKLFFIHWVLAG